MLVLGQVARPGAISFVPGLDVREAIAACGGFTVTASRSGVTVTREALEGRRVRARVSDDEPVLLARGDIVFVGERPA